MAKSLRSKWRRKCRAVKRERYGVKELAQLKKTLGIDDNAPGDADMKEISEIANVTDAKTIREKAAEKEGKEVAKEESMEEDGVRVFNKKTMRDQNGHYPVWMSRRKIAKGRQGRTRTKKAAVKQAKQHAKHQNKKKKNKGKTQ